MATLVFVYGTLLPGMSRFSVLEGATCWGPALLKAKLYDLGPYPAIRLGDKQTVGEVFEVSEATLRQLDAIESFFPEAPERSQYLRREVTVTLVADGSQLTAQTYEWREVSAAKWIPHGDYRRALQEQERPTQRILAYGSNLETARITDRLGAIAQRQTGYIPQFQLRFAKASYSGEHTYASVHFSPGSQCPAVAWELTPEQVARLDEFEGVSTQQYLRVTLPFVSDHEIGWCQGYLAHPDSLVWHLPPTERYLGYLQRGYAEHGFDDKHWQMALQQASDVGFLA
jgi:gamma-glutamylcyclotransferase (GGCT)/AIG2-like uncharacterized protein YtfP